MNGGMILPNGNAPSLHDELVKQTQERIRTSAPPPPADPEDEAFDQLERRLTKKPERAP